MRIITGQSKGRTILVPNIPEIRPAQDIVRQSVFNIIGSDIEKKTILDLFAGSGSFGLEALSRGASWCDFVDIDPRSAQTITKNLETHNFVEKSKVYRMDAQRFIGETPNTYDFVFLSPYYAEGLVKHILKTLCIVLNDNGVIFYDHFKEILVPDKFEGVDGSNLKVIDTRSFGNTSVSILTKE
jgi:16S rRNA (guanine966-N2)-methyltransferase